MKARCVWQSCMASFYEIRANTSRLCHQTNLPVESEAVDNLLEFSRLRATLSSATSSKAKPVGVAIGQVPVCEHHLHGLVKAQQDIHR